MKFMLWLVLELLFASANAQGPDQLLGTAGGNYQLFDTDQAVEAGLPSLTGNAGDCLAVTSGADGIEWGECGGELELSDTTPVQDGTGAAGSATRASRGDHVHPTVPLSDNTPKASGTADAGKGTLGSRDDHVHPAPNVTIPPYSTTATAVHFTGASTPGSANTISRGDHAHHAPLPYATTNPLAAGTAAPGSATTLSRGDHVHPKGTVTIPYATANPVADGTAAPGTADTVSRGDHVHPAGAPTGNVPPYATSATAVLLTGSSAPGDANTISRGDHAHRATLPFSSTDPAADGTADPGSANTISRGDHVHAATAAKIPPYSASATTVHFTGASTPGSANTISRGDHAHHAPLPYSTTASAVSFIGNPAPGTANTLARGDHAHTVPIPAPTDATAGQVLGTNSARTAYQFVTIPTPGAPWPSVTGQAGKVLTVNSAATGVEWAEGGGGGGGGGGGAGWVTIGSGTLTLTANARVNAWASIGTISNFISSDNGAAFLAKMKTDSFYKTCKFFHSAEVIGINEERFHTISLLEPNKIISTATQIRVGGTLEGSFSTSDGRGALEVSGAITVSGANLTVYNGPIQRQFFNRQALSFTFECTENELAGGGGGGGGGGTNPTIPTPTEGASLKTLRANAAGSAYEFGVVAADAGEVQELSDTVQRDIAVLEAQAADLSRVQESAFVDNTDTAEGLYIGNAIPLIEPTWKNNLEPPFPTTGRNIWARLKSGSDPLDYQALLVLDNFTVLERGAVWIRQERESLTHHYYLVTKGFPGGTADIKLQKHTERAGTTSFAGKLTGSDFTTLKAEVSALYAPPSTDASTGDVLTSTCSGATCSVAYKALPTAFRYESIASGQFRHAGGGQATASFAQTGGNALFHNHIISARYQELRIHVNYATIIPSETRLQMCVIPGVAPDVTLNATRTVVINGSMPNISGGISSCYLSIPASGNVTITFGNIGEGGLNTDFHWNMYGIRWP